MPTLDEGDALATPTAPPPKLSAYWISVALLIASKPIYPVPEIAESVVVPNTVPPA